MPDDLTPQQLNWPQFARQGEYRRALAAARLSQAPAEVQNVLEWTVDLQEALRARQYTKAQQQLEALNTALTPEADTSAELMALAPLLDTAALGAALRELQQGSLPQADNAAPQTLTAALACPLTRAEALNVLGVRAAAQGDTPQAQTYFEQAQAADPQHYRALSNLGNMALERGDLQAAADYQRQAVALNDEFATGHHNLGVVLRKQGKLSQSVKHIKRSQRLGLRQAQQQEQRPNWQNPQLLRILGLLLALVVFFWFMRGPH